MFSNAASSTPIDTTPVIFLDTHPSESQPSILGSLYKTIKRDLLITFTGVVERPLGSGELRLKWYTDEGNEGYKDYPLHQYLQCFKGYEEVQKLEDVRRATILGYRQQNPYMLGPDGRNPWVERFEREMKGKKGLGMKPEVLADKSVADGTLDIAALVHDTEVEDERQRMEADRKERELIAREVKKTKEEGQDVDEEEGLLVGRFD